MIRYDEDLSALGLDDWLESYGQRAARLKGKKGPLHPDLSGQVGADVVPGAYDNWHYDALAMYCALREIATQKEKIEQLTKRVKLLEQMALEDD